ncbi:hypothetical protein ACLESO_12220 [Pyxidicoccus sp. 3LG]
MKSAAIFVMTLAASLQLACGMETPLDENESPDPAAPTDLDSEDSRLASESSNLTGPTVSLSCSQSSAGVACSASASGGVPPYTYFWGQMTYLVITNRTYSSLMYEGSPTHGPLTPCNPPTELWPLEARIRVKAYVVDSTGVQSPLFIGSTWYDCGTL